MQNHMVYLIVFAALSYTSQTRNWWDLKSSDNEALHSSCEGLSFEAVHEEKM